MTERSISNSANILIAGGGLVGNTLALALAQRGCSVCLVEARGGALPASESADTRHLALAEGSVMALQRLGVWTALSGVAGPIRRVEISRRGAPGQLRLDAAEHGFERFGAVVPAPRLLQALEQQAAQHDRIEVCRGVQVVGSEIAERQRLVSLCDGSERRAALVVAADGSDSPLRNDNGIPVRFHDYGQSLISCSIRASVAAQGCAFERLDSDGPLALLPRPDGRMGLVWTQGSDSAAQRMEDSDAEFAQRYQDRFGYRLGRLHGPGRRSLWPLRLVYAERLHAQRLVLVGNAAQTLHPIGAQGFNLGLRDALALAMQIAAQPDPGAERLLDAYQSSRQPDREGTLAWTSQLLAMRPGGSPLGPLAAIGLGVTDLVPGLQRGIVQRAMGLAVLPLLPEAA